MEPSENEPKEEGRKHCGNGRHCCCAKLFVAFLLMLLGGILGYLIGRCSSSGYGKGMCGMSMSRPCPMPGMPGQAPAQKEQ